MPEISDSRALHRLIYCSRPELTPGLEDDDLGAIIRASIRYNREVSVTGLLLLHDGWFVQALEGPAEAVRTVYGRIREDDRHSGAQVICAGPTQARARRIEKGAREFSSRFSVLGSRLRRCHEQCVSVHSP